MKKITRRFAASGGAALALVLVFAACYSPWDGGKKAAGGTLTLVLGSGGGAGRAVVNAATEPADLHYKIILESPPEEFSRELDGSGPASFNLAPGTWNIKVWAFGYLNGDSANAGQGKNFPRARGETTVTIHAGENLAETVSMSTVTEVSSWDKLAAAVGGPAEAAAAGDRVEYIYLNGSTSPPLSADPITISRHIILDGGTGGVIDRGTTSGGVALFDVASGGTLILRGDLTLDGKKTGGVTASRALVIVTGGAREIEDGVTLRDNDNISGGGGGVEITSGSFTMAGGIIEGNTGASGGGGGYGNGTGAAFTMSGGEISGNTTGTGAMGGGVYVDGGTFDMNDGIITLNDAPNGGGVYFSGGTAAFTMHGGEISGNSADRGGGVYVVNSGGTVFSMYGGEINGNTAVTGGGGVYVINAVFLLSGGNVRDNTARNPLGDAEGGGIWCNGALTLGGPVEIDGNTAIVEELTYSMARGGGVYIAGTLDFLPLCIVVFKDNRASNELNNSLGGISSGGALFYGNTTPVTIPAGFTFTNNSSASGLPGAGAVYTGSCLTFDAATWWSGNKVYGDPVTGHVGATAVPNDPNDVSPLILPPS
jgi:hypothetical protein